jgi:peptidoglycan-associated lipoprotein
MNFIFGRTILLSGLLMLAGTGCSKKVVKVQPEPVQPKIEQAVPAPPRESDVFQEQEMDASMKGIFVPIYFDYDKYNIRNSESWQLERIGSFLKENTGSRVLIEGHCDEHGSNEYNMGLGDNRARSVRKWMTAYGIPEDRLEITSYGKERPAIAGCNDDGCHAKNRRVEWKILSH